MAAGTFTTCVPAARQNDFKPEVWFDYQLQVWVMRNLVQDCGHPQSMGPECCNQRKYAGCFIWEARALARFCPCDTCVSAQWEGGRK